MWKWTVGVPAPLLIALSLAAGCSLALDFEECGSDADCQALAGGARLVCGADNRCVTAGGTANEGLQFGELCSDNAECTSGLCRDRRCTQPCNATDRQCPRDSGTACEGDVCRFRLAPPLRGPPRLGMLYVGPVGDHGWTKTHDVSRIFVEAKVPELDTAFEPSVPAVNAGEVIDRFIAEGRNIIVGTSFDFVGALQSAALNNPDTYFLSVSGFVSGPNLGSYFGRMYQAKWLAGRLAGQMTTSDKVGYIGPIVIPETVRHLNAFTLGVRSVNPRARVFIRWVHAWFDPPTESAAAEELRGLGIDVVLSSTDTPIAVQNLDGTRTPEGNPVYTIGYDNPDTCELFGRQSCIASAYFNWGPVLERQIKAMIAGTWNPHDLIWEPMKGDANSSIVYLTSPNPALVPLPIIQDVESFIPKIATGEHVIFKGPLQDNSRQVRNDGRDLADSQMLRMCWFVDGVYEPAPGDDFEPAAVPPSCNGDR